MADIFRAVLLLNNPDLLEHLIVSVSSPHSYILFTILYCTHTASPKITTLTPNSTLLSRTRLSTACVVRWSTTAPWPSRVDIETSCSGPPGTVR